MKAFNTLDNRYVFNGELYFTGSVHIGSGESSLESDSPFVKTKDHFFIPGSSLRGALRSTVERISASLNIYTCALTKTDDCECITVNKNTQTQFENKVENGAKENELLKWIFQNKRLCDTCKLFGSPYFASKIKIPDLYLTNGQNPSGIIRNGVAIDRDTDTAKEGALFDIEVLENGTRFQFEIIAENMEEQDFALLAIGLQELLKGRMIIGAKSAAGLGKCVLQNLQIKYFDNSSTFTLREYLKIGDYSKKSNPNSFITGKISNLFEEKKKNAKTTNE